MSLLSETGGGGEMRSVPEIKDKRFNWVCSSGFIQYKEIYARGVHGRRPRVESNVGDEFYIWPSK